MAVRSPQDYRCPAVPWGMTPGEACGFEVERVIPYTPFLTNIDACYDNNSSPLWINRYPRQKRIRAMRWISPHSLLAIVFPLFFLFILSVGYSFSHPSSSSLSFSSSCSSSFFFETWALSLQRPGTVWDHRALCLYKVPTPNQLMPPDKCSHTDGPVHSHRQALYFLFSTSLFPLSFSLLSFRHALYSLSSISLSTLSFLSPA